MKIVITSANSAMGLMLIPVLVHLSGELNAKNERLYKEANLDTTRVVTEHARAKQLIYLSYPHASPLSGDHRCGASASFISRVGWHTH